jgi:hypothetical protein
MKLKFIVILAAMLIAGLSTGSAEEKFGINVYEGASYDAISSEFLREAMFIDAFCYRTNDSVSKVAEFYRKQPGNKFTGGSAENARFKIGNIDITIQNPWMEVTTGKMMKNTLISIVKLKR